MRRSITRRPPSPVKKKSRGHTKLAKVIAHTVEHKQENHLELNAQNRSEGPIAKKFSSYLGSMARNKVDMLTNEWKHIDDKVKDQCWLDILQFWDVPDTKDFKRLLLGENSR